MSTKLSQVRECHMNPETREYPGNKSVKERNENLAGLIC